MFLVRFAQVDPEYGIMTRFVNAVACEDVRVEVNRKTILIGTFFDEIIFREFPGELPRLSILIEVFSPIDEPVIKNINIVGFLYGEKIAELPPGYVLYPPQELIDQQRADGKKYLIGRAQWDFLPVSFEKPGTLEIVAYDGDKEFGRATIIIRPRRENDPSWS